MKYLWTGVGILAFCLALCICTTVLLGRYTDRAVSLLEEAARSAAAGSASAALEKVERAMAEWEGKKGFFGMTLRHDELDEVGRGFHELRVRAREPDGEFAPACAGLIEQVRHISDMEKPCYYNIF